MLMKLYMATFSVLLVMSTQSSLAAEMKDISRDKIRSVFQKSLQSGESTAYRVNLGHGRSGNVKIEVTLKGNGAFILGNLNLRILDVHDDGVVYQGDCLDVDAIDIDNDGYIDLVISGIVVHTGEKDTDPILRESVAYIYKQERSNPSFTLIYKKGSIDIDMSK